MHERRYHVLAMVSEDEHVRVHRLAKSRGLTVSALVRRAINTLLLDEGEEVPLLDERHEPGRRRIADHAA